jgi:hypothetical protein
MSLKFTPEEIKAFRAVHFAGFTDEQFDLAIAECERQELIPGQHVVFQLRSAREYVPDMNSYVQVKKLTKVTTIEAFRLISQRTGQYRGQGKGRWTYLDTEGNPTITSTIPLPDPKDKNLPREPWCCAVPVYREGFIEPIEVECRFDAYAVTRKLKDNTVVLTEMWERRGPEMLLKCSEAAARRVAFPQELGGFYLSEEFAKEDSLTSPPATEPDPIPVTEAPKAVQVPQVDHTPVQPKETPRPGEDVPKKTPKKKTEPKDEEPIVEPLKPGEQTNSEISDADLPAEMFEKVQNLDEPAEEEDRLPTKEEGKKLGETIRSYYTYGLTQDALKAFYLRKTQKEKPSEIGVKAWAALFAEMDKALEKGGKKALVDLVTF